MRLFARIAALAIAALSAGGTLAVASAEPSTPQHGTRTLYLLRHGAYDEADTLDAEVGKALTTVGREQARLAAARLASLPAPPTTIHASTMTRARQTAEIVGATLHLEPRLSPELRECTPPTWRTDIRAQTTASEVIECRDQLERAYRRHFRPTAGPDSVEVVVCHGNVIRYFWCRALGVNPRAWAGMTTYNCGLTILQVRPNGTCVLVSYNDASHLPPELRTGSAWRAPARADSTAKR